MQCELLFFYENKDWKRIDKNLKSIDGPFQIITTSESLNKFLHKKGIKSKTLRDIFPEEGEITYKIHSRAKEIQVKYRELFKNVKYRDGEIFPSIENQLLDEIIIYEKAKHVLENKLSTIFVFEGYSFTYFAIKKLSVEMGYTSDVDIGQLQRGKVKAIKLQHNQRFLLLKNKWKFFRLRYFYPGSSNDLFQRFISRKLKNPVKHIFIELIGKYIIWRIFNNIILFLSSSRMKRKTFKKLDVKLEEQNFGKFPIIGFFLTTNREDLYLKSIYPILDKLKENNQKFLISVIDIETKLILNKKRISYFDLFKEINLLTEILKKETKGKETLKEIKNIAIKNEISILFYDKFSEHLVHEVFRTMALLEIVDHIFSNIQMKKIIVGTDGVMFGNSVISIAKKYNIQSFFIPGIVINKNPLHANWYKADKICLYGQQGIESLKSLGYNKEKLVMTGNPKYDFLKKFDTKKSKIQLMQQHHVDSEKKLIVIGMARWHNNDEEWMSKVIQFCNKNNFEIVIKIHPMYKLMLKETSNDKISLINKKCENLRYFITMDMDLHTLLSAADLVITDYSNVGVEAMILEKPLLTVNFVKESFENEQKYHEFGASLYFEDYSKLEETIKDILIDGKYLQDLKKGRNKIFEQYNIHNDGKATERVIDLITNDTNLSTTEIK